MSTSWVFELTGTCLDRTRRFLRLSDFDTRYAWLSHWRRFLISEHLSHPDILLCNFCLLSARDGQYCRLQILLQWQNTAHLLIEPSNVLPGPVTKRQKNVTWNIANTRSKSGWCWKRQLFGEHWKWWSTRIWRARIKTVWETWEPVEVCIKLTKLRTV